MKLHATRGAERGTERDSDASGMRENAQVNRSWHRTRVRRCKTAAEMPKPESERSVNLPAEMPSTQARSCARDGMLMVPKLKPHVFSHAQRDAPR